MTRCITAIAAIVFCINPTLEAEAAESPRYPSRYRRMAPAHALLYKAVERVAWLDAPLEDVFDWLKTQAHGRVNVLPRWRALRTAGLTESTPITLEMRNVNVAEVIDEVIEQLAPVGSLRYRAYGNKFVLTSKADHDRQLYLRVYDVTELIQPPPDTGRGAPVIDLSQTVGGGATTGTVFGGGGGQDRQGSDDRGEQEQQDKLDELMNLIRATIAPGSWMSSGLGGPGRIRAFNNSILVLNTIEVHEALAGAFSFGQ